MARRPRLDFDGFHHIVNRGVARSNIYKCDEDKEKFLEILWNSAIIEVLKDGYTQGEVARHLDVSAALVSYIFRNFDN